MRVFRRATLGYSVLALAVLMLLRPSRSCEPDEAQLPMHANFHEGHGSV